MNEDILYLKHIRDAIGKVETYTAVGRDVFFLESHWQDAVIRQLEIIGEATKHLSKALKSRYPKVEWRRIAGLRDVLIHNYMGVDLDAVWEITQRRLPGLKQSIFAIIEDIEKPIPQGQNDSEGVDDAAI